MSGVDDASLPNDAWMVQFQALCLRVGGGGEREAWSGQLGKATGTEPSTRRAPRGRGAAASPGLTPGPLSLPPCPTFPQVEETPGGNPGKFLEQGFSALAPETLGSTNLALAMEEATPALLGWGQVPDVQLEGRGSSEKEGRHPKPKLDTK